MDQLKTDISAANAALAAADFSKLDAAVSSRAQQSTLVSRADAIDTALSSKASQNSLDQGVTNILGAIQSRFDELAGTVVAQQPLQLQVVEIQAKRRYLVYVLQRGMPLAGAALARVQALELKNNGPVVVTDITSDSRAANVK